MKKNLLIKSFSVVLFSLFCLNIYAVEKGSKDYKVEYLTSDELQITETGQVSTSLGGETVYSLNRKEAQKSVEELNRSRKNLKNHLQNIVASAEKLSGYIAPHKLEETVFTEGTKGMDIL